MGVSIFNTGYDLQDQIDAAESAIAIVSIGSTHAAITSGQYVYVREHGTLAEGLYRATANIAANGTLSSSNVTAVSGGGLNALNSNMIPLDGILTFSDVHTDVTISDTIKLYTKIGNIVILNISITTSANLSAWAELFTITNSNISIKAQRTIAGNMPFYISSNKIQNTTALPSGTYNLQFIVDIN